MLTVLLLLAAQDPAARTGGDPVDAAFATYREKTRADVPCRTPDSSDEIVVCARRDADEHRVPLVMSASRRDSVPLRTGYLIAEHSALPCGQGAFLARCGSVGVSTTIGFDGKIRLVTRELAP